MPPRLIDRQDAADQESYWRNADELDLVASWILATVWSGTNAQGKQAQNNIGLRTVAVVRLNTGGLVVASNATSFDPYQIPFNPNSKAVKSTPNFHYALSGYKQGDVVFDPQAQVRAVLGEIYATVDFPPECCGTGFSFHAEMALLQHMSKHNLHPSPKFIGVSKPCCRFCRAVLKGAGMDHSFYHMDAVASWDEPVIAPNWTP